MGIPDRELEVGDLFAGHRITGIAGRGGMGVVYRAEQLDLQRPVALKLIATPLARDAAFRERFVRESRAAAAIDHPNVIPVYGAGEEDGRLYLAMRLVAGDDLRTLVHDDGPLSPQRAAALTAQVAGALDAAHARGLVHRDIKPANVLLDGDHAYLTDFGLTKRLAGGEETTMTGAGRWVGTLGYVAPEQIRGEAVDARADVYALGCLLFFMLTGVAPYRRESDEATLYAHLTAPPPDPRELEPVVPEGMADVVRRALEKDPADRFPSAGDLGRAALAAVGDAPTPPPERTVARGAAAPGGDGDEETAVTPTDVAATAVAPQRQRAPARLRGGFLTLLSLLAGAAVVVGVVLLLNGSGDDDHGGRGTTATTTTAPGAATSADATHGTPKAGAPVGVDPRPNAIAYADGRVWVSSAASGRLIGLPADGRGPRRTLALGWDAGTSSVAAGFGSLWVTNSATSELVRLDPGTGRVQARIPMEPGALVKVAAGAGAVWVGRRQDNAAQAISSIIKVDPDSDKVTSTQPFGEEGIGDVTTGGGFVWIPNRQRNRLSRLTPSTGARRSVAIGLGPHYAAFGNGSVWVTNAGEGTVSQIAPGFDPNVEQLVGAAPTGVAVGGGAVWVANRLGDTVARLDASTGRLIGQPVAVGRNPYAIVARGRNAWVTSLGDSTVTRITVS